MNQETFTNTDKGAFRMVNAVIDGVEVTINFCEETQGRMAKDGIGESKVASAVFVLGEELLAINEETHMMIIDDEFSICLTATKGR